MYASGWWAGADEAPCRFSLYDFACIATLAGEGTVCEMQWLLWWPECSALDRTQLRLTSQHTPMPKGHPPVPFGAALCANALGLGPDGKMPLESKIALWVVLFCWIALGLAIAIACACGTGAGAEDGDDSPSAAKQRADD
eukprot:866152-Prymnesium_polylepis.1